jgi:putative heme-binding domain-containing protein
VNAALGPEHYIWLYEKDAAELTQLAAKMTPSVQALRALAEHPAAAAGQARATFVTAVVDADPRVQLAALHGLFASPPGAVPQQVIDGPARSADTYLRHTAAMLIAEKAPISQLQSILQSDDATTRMAGILATGFRLTIPPATGPLPEGLTPDSKAQANSYIVPNYFDSPKVDLRTLGPIGNFTMAQWWKGVKHSSEQEALFAALEKSLSDPDKQNRYEAAFFLNILNDSRVAPRVAEVLTEFAPKSLGPKHAIAEAWSVGPFADSRKGFNLSHAPEEGPINLSLTYPSTSESLKWNRVAAVNKVFDFDKLLARKLDSSDYAYFRIESAKSQPIVLWVGSQQQVRVYHNGRVLWENSAGRAFKADEDRIPLTLQTGSNDFLIRVHTSARALLSVSYEAADPVRVFLPDPMDTQQLAERLSQAKDAKDLEAIPPEFAKINWETEWKTGDAAHGRQLFDSLGCSKCHAATSDSPGGGAPSLAEAGKRFTIAYVTESILLPNKVVSPLFRSTVVRLNSGDLFGGLIVNETPDKLDMRLQDTTLKTFNKSDINARKQEEKSPMPQGLVRTPTELKDLLAYVMRDAVQ